jgi:hypothetical protein
MKQPEYTEGPEALENFEQFARAMLQAPKPKGKAKKQTKATTSRKDKNAGEGLAEFG